MRRVFALLSVALAVAGSLFATETLAQRNLAVAPIASSEQRIALVIGNAAYQSGALANPVNDARAVATRLRTLGFDVTLRENLKTRDIGGVYREFRNKITPGAVALVFYAGHGVQVKGQNYFPAVDSEIASEEDVPLQSLNLGTLLDNMEEAKAGVSLVFLDACRDNPFARRFRSAARGLAKVEAASGTLIHYATRPGSVAADGDGRNGTYTEALLAQIGEPGVPVELMLKQVTNRVVTRTKGKQEPWVEGSLRGEFYFIFQGPATVRVQPPDPTVNERTFWESVKDTKNADELKAYLDQFPNGLFVALARTRLKALGQSPAPTQIASTAPNIAATRPPGSIASMSAGTVFRDCEGCPEMVVIPAGSFTMGSPAWEPRNGDEGPQHQVRISRPFAAGKYEVTFDEWDRCVREGGCSQSPSDSGWGRGKRPVINVSWQDAKQYTEWLSRTSGRNYRLLTEAEWEYAARAGTSTAFSFGNSITPQQANYDTKALHLVQANYDTNASYAASAVTTSRGQTVPVGSYAPNAFGLYDVHGNVWEWTEDCENSSYNSAPADGSAWTSGNCGQRVRRGGAWISHPASLRSASRFTYLVVRDDALGFRLARTD